MFLESTRMRIRSEYGSGRLSDASSEEGDAISQCKAAGCQAIKEGSMIFADIVDRSAAQWLVLQWHVGASDGVARWQLGGSSGRCEEYPLTPEDLPGERLLRSRARRNTESSSRHQIEQALTYD